ncbi:hypothetical protein F4827_001627 [Paraburkholderia bannensis]|uniref:Uncharacterized protein n=1 Tax=Paraburkholderia bannensis TaxID=765414 RepID=A0A7W9TUX8_9BURK|nr:hypothetical protein [Paraburkholderia sp. WP4_3_2]MBB6101779.1 hypothetical protein [Paraburkholderia bannensis]
MAAADSVTAPPPALGINRQPVDFESVRFD